MKKVIASLACLVLFFSNINAIAGSITIPRLYQSYKSDISYSAEKIMQNQDAALGTAAIIGASFFADKAVKSYFIKNQNKTMNHFADFVTPLGSGLYILPIAAGLGAIGYISKDDKLLNSSYTSVESGLTAAVITGGIKFIVGRARPRITDSTTKFKPFNLHNNYQSFPSGDVTVAWSVITPYAISYHQPLLYLIPLSVDIERMYKNAHWLSDTVMGTAVGFWTGYLFSNAHISKGFTFFTDGKTIDIAWKF